MINVLGWYEILYSVGANIGPGLPALLSFVNIKVGWWVINENNFIQVITAFSVFLIFIVSWFQVIDLSKELDLIKAEFDRDGTTRLTKKNDNPKVVHVSNSPERNLMTWTDLLQFDILLLAFSYAFMRVVVLTTVTGLTLISSKTFHWNLNTLSLLHFVTGFITFFLITILVKLKVFKGRRTIFFAYIVAMCSALLYIPMLMLPKAINMTSMSSQIVFGSIILFLKSFVIFQANSSGKFLIFNIVSYDNANFVDGFRSFVGIFFKFLANMSVFYFFL